MCGCLSFPSFNDSVTMKLADALVSLISKIGSWTGTFSYVKIRSAHRQQLHGKSTSFTKRTFAKSRKLGVCISSNGTLYVVKKKQDICLATSLEAEKQSDDVKRGSVKTHSIQSQRPRRYAGNGKSGMVCLFTKQGQKGVNQDAMLVLENFTSRADTTFCGVFDGHGPDGHRVARNVRDILPQKLESCQRALESSVLSEYSSQKYSDTSGTLPMDPELISAWKDSFLSAYKLMDRELLADQNVDCISSGTTAVTLVKQGNDLYIGGVGDSRAVLGVRADNDSLLALQLTVDLKPTLPGEVRRIRRLKGRVFALHREPHIKRVWLPDLDVPGLAMARALGDYCLKNFGVISEPIVTYRRLTGQEKFIVLATDGVWDVLSNEQVVRIVASAPVHSSAAKVVVDAAVTMWSKRHFTSKMDDCAVVCLFLENGAMCTSKFTKDSGST